jgi:hypothetical protein
MCGARTLAHVCMRCLSDGLVWSGLCFIPNPILQYTEHYLPGPKVVVVTLRVQVHELFSPHQQKRLSVLLGGGLGHCACLYTQSITFHSFLQDHCNLLEAIMQGALFLNRGRGGVCTGYAMQHQLGALFLNRGRGEVCAG